MATTGTGAPAPSCTSPLIIRTVRAVRGVITVRTLVKSGPNWPSSPRRRILRACGPATTPEARAARTTSSTASSNEPSVATTGTGAPAPSCTSPLIIRTSRVARGVITVSTLVKSGPNWPSSPRRRILRASGPATTPEARAARTTSSTASSNEPSVATTGTGAPAPSCTSPLIIRTSRVARGVITVRAEVVTAPYWPSSPCASILSVCVPAASALAAVPMAVSRASSKAPSAAVSVVLAPPSNQ